MASEDFIQYAATATKADGTYAYSLADLMAVLRDGAETKGEELPLRVVHQVSMHWGKARNDHQQRASTGRNGR